VKVNSGEGLDGREVTEGILSTLKRIISSTAKRMVVEK